MAEKRQISFSPPDMSEAEVAEALWSGWIMILWRQQLQKKSLTLWVQEKLHVIMTVFLSSQRGKTLFYHENKIQKAIGRNSIDVDAACKSLDAEEIPHYTEGYQSLGHSMMKAYRNLGFDIKGYPNAYNRFANEITLPLHICLTVENVEMIMDM